MWRMPSEIINQITMPPQTTKATSRKIKPKPVRPSSIVLYKRELPPLSSPNQAGLSAAEKRSSLGS